MVKEIADSPTSFEPDLTTPHPALGFGRMPPCWPKTSTAFLLVVGLTKVGTASSRLRRWSASVRRLPVWRVTNSRIATVRSAPTLYGLLRLWHMGVVQ